MEHTVSIIIPAHNVEPYLRRCLDSILSQQHRALEVLCVDDGSTDGTAALLDEYASADPRVKAIHQENAGAGIARNRAIEMAGGDYVMFVDADDYLEEDAVALALGRIVSTGADMCIFDAQDFDAESGKRLHHNYIKRAFLPEGEVFSPAQLGGGLFQCCALNCWNKIYRRELFADERLRFLEGIRYEDVYFCFASMVLPQKITCLFKKLYHYRRNRVGSQMATDAKSCADTVEAFRRTRQKLKEGGLLDDAQVAHSFDEKANGVLLFIFSFQTDLDAFRAYYDLLRSPQGLQELGLLGKPADYYGDERERKKLAALMDSADSEGFLFYEYHYCYRELLDKLQQNVDLSARLRAAEKKAGSLERSKNALQKKWDAQNRHFLVRVDRKLRRMFGKNAK